MDNKNFKSRFGFLMAAVGSAVGVGNLWGFPYKMGANGGFAFLLCYAFCVVIGYVIMTGELAIGRSGGKGVIENYKLTGKRHGWIGVLAALSVLLITGFCCTLTAYCMKYFLANLGTLLNASWGINGGDAAAYWDAFLSNGLEAALLTLLCVVITMVILFKGTSGIEKFCKYAMPLLVLLLLIVIGRSLSLPGSSAGLAFMFKPDWSVFQGTGWITVFARAGGQAFFSLSLGMAIMITYGAYLNKTENIGKNAALICFFDTLVAILAGVAIFPAVFAFGHEPAGGTGLLFVTLQTVFTDMGMIGAFFGCIFYLLAVIAELTSLVSLFEPQIAFINDVAAIKGKTISRTKLVIGVSIFNFATGALVAFDALGKGGLIQPLGFCWMDFFDLFSEGILMPIGALAMTLILGWKLGPKWMEAEMTQGGNTWKSKQFYMVCLKYIAPLFILLVFAGQISNFFGLGWF